MTPEAFSALLPVRGGRADRAYQELHAAWLEQQRVHAEKEAELRGAIEESKAALRWARNTISKIRAEAQAFCQTLSTF